MLLCIFYNCLSVALKFRRTSYPLLINRYKKTTDHGFISNYDKFDLKVSIFNCINYTSFTMALSFSAVNSRPLRFFKRKPASSSGGSGAKNRKFILFDFSGSMTGASQRGLLELCARYPDIFIIPFGMNGRGSMTADWRGWLESIDNCCVRGQVLLAEWTRLDIPHKLYRTHPTFFPWGTYTDRIRIGLQGLPQTGGMIDLVFVGDGSFSDGDRFIAIMEEAGHNGWLKNVENFAFLLAHNASAMTERNLTPKLQKVLTATRSSINWITYKLNVSRDDLIHKISSIKSSGIVVPDGWLFFDAGDGPQLFHEKLTPKSIAAILMTNQGLIPDYVDYLVRVFKNTPVVFTREDNISSTIFQALKFLRGVNNDQFNIKKSLVDRFSKANKTALHRTAFKILRTSSNTAEKLFIEEMHGDFSGEFLLIKSATGSCPFSSADVDDALRDMSFSTFIRLLDNSFSESSGDTIQRNTREGFPIIADCADWNKKAIKSMRMLPFLLGQDGRLISGNFMMVGAMYILTSEHITEPYLRRVAEAFIFSEDNKPKLRSLIYKPDSDEIQDNIYSATFARVIYHFCQVYRDQLAELGVDFDLIKNIYVALCKILIGRNFSYKIPVTTQGYTFAVGDFVLISPDSWPKTGKECPYPEMVNLAYITEANPKERNFRRGAYRLRFLEGDSMDYTYVSAEFMTKLAYSSEITPEIKKTIRKFQRNMWLKWLHFPDRKDGSDDGKEMNRDGTLVTFKQNLHAIMRMIDPRHNLEIMPKQAITKELVVPQSIISAITGIDGGARITKDTIEATRTAIDVVPDPISLVESIPVDDRTIRDDYGTFTHIIDESDIEAISKEFTRRHKIKCAGYECACGCEAIIRPGVVYENPGCGHHYIPKCLATYTASCVQDPMDIRFDVSTCPMGCPGCITPLIYMNDRTAVITSQLDDTLVNASARNVIGRCQSCCDYFVRGPRDCATAHTLPIQCQECLPKRFWTCPGIRGDGTRCTVMTEHGGGCRMMQCCPIRDGWDDPCKPGCSHSLKWGDIIVSIGCGHRYKMDDGLEQDDGTAVSDGSQFY